MVAGARETLAWLSPSPTWTDFGSVSEPAQREEFLRPAILRFAHDGFMDELLGTLAYRPDRLGEWRVAPETWEKPLRTPPAATELVLPEPVSALSVQLARRKTPLLGPPSATANAPARGGDPTRPLKLYQPAQLRHYLVTASLVCQRPGLPDRRVEPGKQESAAFVLRRIVPPEGATEPAADPNTWDEYAFVHDERGLGWHAVGSAGRGAERILPGEERLPLFALGFDETPGKKRRLFAGTIPVGRREAYVAAPLRSVSASGDGADAQPDAFPSGDPRRLLFQMRVTSPWNELVQQSLDEIEKFERSQSRVDPPFDAADLPSSPDSAAVRLSREQAQTLSWYVALDLERFLFDHVPRVHKMLTGGSERSDLDAATEEPLVAWLEGVVLAPYLKSALGANAKNNLLEVLKLLATDPSIGQKLERVETTYDASSPHADWPAFVFPLANSMFANPVNPLSLFGQRKCSFGPFPFRVKGNDLSGRGNADHAATLAPMDAALAELADLVERALPAAATAAPPPEIHVQSNPAFDTRVAWFAIRCVYERPNCGPFDPPVVGAPTRPFQMATFFDPDAPARPVRIALPFDITPAGLRKFPKGATLMVSDLLCGQLKKIRQLSLGDLVLSVLPWPFHKPLPNVAATGPCRAGADSLGMFCSLSIPIVTLCALILLIIIVALFDMFFRWLPLLFFCFPVKLFSGKRS